MKKVLRVNTDKDIVFVILLDEKENIESGFLFIRERSCCERLVNVGLNLVDSVRSSLLMVSPIEGENTVTYKPPRF